MSSTPRRLVVGTAGHIDHGKTSMVQALTGVNLDSLPEEQERGITINLGFVGLQLESDCSLAFIDVPGHERGRLVAFTVQGHPERPQGRYHHRILRGAGIVLPGLGGGRARR